MTHGPINIRLRPVASFEHQNGTGMARTLCHITVRADSRSKASNLYAEGVRALMTSRFSTVFLQLHHTHSKIVSFHIFLGSIIQSFNNPNAVKYELLKVSLNELRVETMPRYSSLGCFKW